MTQMTQYVVQSFVRTKRGAIVPDAPVLAQSAGHAKRMAERLSQSKAGVVAFSRAGDPATGDYDDAVKLFAVGALPEEVVEAA